MFIVITLSRNAITCFLESSMRSFFVITSRNDSDFESSNVSLKENKPDGVNPSSNDIDYYVRKNEGKILWFSAD